MRNAVVMPGISFSYTPNAAVTMRSHCCFERHRRAELRSVPRQVRCGAEYSRSAGGGSRVQCPDFSTSSADAGLPGNPSHPHEYQALVQEN